MGGTVLRPQWLLPIPAFRRRNDALAHGRVCDERGADDGEYGGADVGVWKG